MTVSEEEDIKLERIEIARTIITENISASYDDIYVFLNVSGYSGAVYYEIESIDGGGGYLCGCQVVVGEGRIIISTASLSSGDYRITIRTNCRYIGRFSI